MPEHRDLEPHFAQREVLERGLGRACVSVVANRSSTLARWRCRRSRTEIVLYRDGPDLEELALSPAGMATARRLLAVLWAFTHSYPIEEDDEDEDEQQRLRVLDTAAALCGFVEAAFSNPTEGYSG